MTEPKPAIVKGERPKRMAPTFSEKKKGNVSLILQDDHQVCDLYGMKSALAATGVLMTAINALGESGAIYRDFIMALAEDIEPRDAVEAMLTTQMGATHVAMSECARRMADAQILPSRESHERSMTRLSRTYLAQMDSLKRYRAKAQQTVRVERVEVREGGQAIIGDVTHTGGRG